MYLKSGVGVTAFSTGKEESDGRKGEGRGGGKGGGLHAFTVLSRIHIIFST